MAYVRCKTWALIQNELGQDDLLWFTGIGVRVNVERPSHSFNDMNGGIKRIYGKPNITIESETKKQENLLQLKYGGNLLLLSDIIYTEGYQD